MTSVVTVINILVYDDNQSDSRKDSRWRSGVSPPEDFDSLTAPLLVQKDSNSNSSEEENNTHNDDAGGDVTLDPFR